MTNKKKNDKKQECRYINRDASWLSFNSRVLDEASDPGNPLLEQLKFISIFSSNLDEFFMVRIAGISGQTPYEVQKVYKDYSYLPGKLLSELEKTIRRLVAKQYEICDRKILPSLAEHGIALKKWDDLSTDEQSAAKAIFMQEILPVLTPIGIDPSHPFPLVPNLALELLVRLRRKGKECFAVMEVPAVIPRFLTVGETAGDTGKQLTLVAAEDVIANHLDVIFSGSEILEWSTFRITRDMDFSIDEESIADLMTEMQIAMRKKTKRSVVRLEVAETMSEKSRKWLVKMLDVEEHQIYDIPGYLNLKAMFQIAGLSGFPELSDGPMPPLPSIFCDEHKSMFENIRNNGPFFTHLPYESFDPVVRLLEEAAVDPDVLAIKQTLYRVSKNSPIVKALVTAARNGKQVCVLFEIKARFDEENNMRGARELAEAGAHVVYGIAGLKVHCKALLVVRRETAGIRRYVHLSTGNYNERTARQYTDLGYFSDDDILARDVASLFNVITGFSDPPPWNKLLVAPFTIKDKLLYMIDREAGLSGAGRPGHIMMKVNSIIDYEVIDHLYAAAEKGVKIELIVRGICGLNPAALSAEAAKNFKIISILDRFLEHARIYYFANNGVPDYYIGSADVMPRNLRRRIETLFPVQSPALRKDLDMILEMALNDKRKGRRILSGTKYTEPKREEKFDQTRSQYGLYEYYRKRREKFMEKPLKKQRLSVYRQKTDK